MCVQNYSKEYADIMAKVEYSDKTEKVNYRKQKFYAVSGRGTEETERDTNCMTYDDLDRKYQRLSHLNTLRVQYKAPRSLCQGTEPREADTKGIFCRL